MGILKIDHATKTFQIGKENLKVLNEINLDIEKGEFISIVGTSGCGKSTLLKMISSLETTTTGKIYVEGEEVVKPSPKVSVVFQEPRLLQWMNVRNNIEFVLPKKYSKKEKREISDKIIEMVGLTDFANAAPHQLSGGMQQRVNIARAFATSPDILLLDEPFGALDAFTRITMQNELLNIWEKKKTTVVLVTHDIDEAIFLSDRIIVMSERPGSIKNEVLVNMDRPRNRNNPEFLKIRKNIMNEFLGGRDLEIEYYI